MRKPIIILLTGLQALLFTGLLSAQQFEGIITASYGPVGFTGSSTELDWYIGAEKIALEMVATPEGSRSVTRFIADPAAEEMTILTNAGGQRFYHEVGLAKLTTAKGASDHLKVEKTGRERTVNGYACYEMIIENEGAQTTAWVTDAIVVDWSRFARYFKSDPAIAALAQMGRSGFPVLVVTHNLHGQEVLRVEMQRVEKREAEKAWFEVPEGYLKVEQE